MAFELIFELGIISFMIVLIGAIVIAIISLAEFGRRALRTRRSEDFIFALAGALFLASILLIIIGVIVIVVTL